MFDEGRSDDNKSDQIRKASEGRLRRTTERATRHESRRAILGMLADDGRGAELTEGQASARLPGKQRGNHLHARYHLGVLHRCGLLGHDDSDPLRYRLI